MNSTCNFFPDYIITKKINIYQLNIGYIPASDRCHLAWESCHRFEVTKSGLKNCRFCPGAQAHLAEAVEKERLGG